MLTVTDAAVEELSKYTKKTGKKSFEIIFCGYG